jgi:hypothetical protein
MANAAKSGANLEAEKFSFKKAKIESRRQTQKTSVPFF